MPTLSLASAGQALIHEPLSPSPSSAAIAALFGSADAAIVNFEAAVDCAGAWPTKTRTLHTARPEALRSLRELGLTVLTHANNHAFDLGPPGLAETRRVAEAAGLRLAGSGRDRDEAAAPALSGAGRRRIAVIGVDLGPQPDIAYAGPGRAGVAPLRMRRRVTVPGESYDALRRLAADLGDEAREAARAAVGYRGRPLPADGFELFGTEIRRGAAASSRFEPEAEDWAALVAGIAAAHGQAALVAVALHNHHWDGDWGATPGWLLDLSRGIIEAGADAVIGTGAPVLQPIALHRGRPILPGLGNLVFHTGRGPVYDGRGVPVWTGAAIRCDFDADSRRCLGIGILPLAVGRPPDGPAAEAPSPVPLAGAPAEAVFAFLTQNLDAAERGLVSRL